MSNQIRALRVGAETSPHLTADAGQAGPCCRIHISRGQTTMTDTPARALLIAATTIALLSASPRLTMAQPAETVVPDKVKLFIPYREYSADDNKRILAMYKWLRVADVSDGMDVVGLQDIGTVHQDIHTLWKDTERFTHRTVGIAVTARYVPTNRREPKMDDKAIGQWYGTITSEAFMKMLAPGSMLVIDAMEDGESRSIGSSNILAWKKLGMVGLAQRRQSPHRPLHCALDWFSLRAAACRTSSQRIDPTRHFLNLSTENWGAANQKLTNSFGFAGNTRVRTARPEENHRQIRA
jgi:hypothetical protein